MPTIKKALGYSILSTVLSGIIFFSLFFSIIAIPWQTTTYKYENGGQIEAKGSINLDPAYLVTVENSTFSPYVLLPGSEGDETEPTYYYSLEEMEKSSEENGTGVYAVSGNTRILVLVSFLLSLGTTISIILVARSTVKKKVGVAVGAVALLLLLSTSFYYPVMMSKEVSDDPYANTTFGEEFKGFFYSRNTETDPDNQDLSSTTSRMVGLGWIFFLLSTIFTGIATVNTNHYFIFGNQLHMSRKQKKQRGTIYANLEEINPGELDGGAGISGAPGSPQSPQFPGPISQPQQMPSPAAFPIHQPMMAPLATAPPLPSMPPQPSTPPQLSLPPMGGQASTHLNQQPGVQFNYQFANNQGLNVQSYHNQTPAPNYPGQQPQFPQKSYPHQY